MSSDLNLDLHWWPNFFDKYNGVSVIGTKSCFQGPAFRCDKIVVIVTLLEVIKGIPDKDYNFGERQVSQSL